MTPYRALPIRAHWQTFVPTSRLTPFEKFWDLPTCALQEANHGWSCTPYILNRQWTVLTSLGKNHRNKTSSQWALHVKLCKQSSVARFRETVTPSNALLSLMSDGREMGFQVPPKTFRLDDRIVQGIWPWVQHCRAGNCESPSATSTVTKPWLILTPAAEGAVQTLSHPDSQWCWSRAHHPQRQIYPVW